MEAWCKGLKQLHLGVINSLITHSARAVPVVSLTRYHFKFLRNTTHMDNRKQTRASLRKTTVKVAAMSKKKNTRCTS